ncbi:membrane protein DedA, SNARE-associated domain [Anaerosporobacter mobilis DSM 15930]|jgi:membrane protein DedA with SNARE-associated domain|uniref:Membrane protein DedA, SNARE-associated domain n=1 Tax=Anaerosporobacter mobilis DSM 15930 TaxID=1120996 RepID=A0A1M7J164_9FIRM|nr:DedA family protein [Anaerosporobacter mobilis]SHM46653.1 membrane protein DedA, SNARE-associated domain [Anaerosporobacter mobilis DSM 15930]
MDITTLTEFFNSYGVLIIFLIVFCEYLNLPGFPAGIIMPLAGIWASKGEVGIVTTMVISLFAGLCGSWMLYLIGRFGGNVLLPKYYKRFPKQEIKIKRLIEKIENRGNLYIFISKLLPVVRTLISFPAGIIKMNFFQFTVYSGLGILIWNGVFIGAGYFFGEQVIGILS